MRKQYDDSEDEEFDDDDRFDPLTDDWDWVAEEDDDVEDDAGENKEEK